MNRIGDSGASSIAEALALNSSLTCLECVSCTLLRCDCVILPAIRLLLLLSSANHHYCSLCICHLRLSRKGEQAKLDPCHQSSAPRPWWTLGVPFRLQGNNIGNQGMLALSQALERNCSLIALWSVSWRSPSPHAMLPDLSARTAYAHRDCGCPPSASPHPNPTHNLRPW